MKLVAAKCPNCGAKIKLNKEDRIYSCDYCRYDILLDDTNSAAEKNKNINTDEHKVYLNTNELKNISKIALVPFIFSFVFIVVVIIIMIGMISNFSVKPNSNNEVETTVSTSTFNVFIDDVGVKYTNTVTFILEKVISNIDEYDKKITIIYNEEEVTDLQQLIIDIGTDPFNQFEITNQKDNDGYINQININSKN